MPAIGYVTKDENGAFKGQLKTLSIRAEISIVLAGDIEIGAGWNRRSETTGKDYVSLSFAAPEFGPRRLYANLGQAAGQSDSRFAIIWNAAD